MRTNRLPSLSSESSMPSLRSLLLLLLPVILSGCAIGARNFDCPGMPDGAICKTPQEVYKLTNNADRVNPDGEPAADTAKTLAATAALIPRQLMEPITQPMPVLEPAATMRAWIAPWIDNRGDLHFPSLLFTEVTPRRWAFGEAVGRDSRVLVPMATSSGAGDRLLERYEDSDKPPMPGPAGNLPGIPPLPSPLPAN